MAEEVGVAAEGEHQEDVEVIILLFYCLCDIPTFDSLSLAFQEALEGGVERAEGVVEEEDLEVADTKLANIVFQFQFLNL